jgi:type I restriction enzyme S subunit
MNQYPLPQGWHWARLGEICEEVYRYPTYYNIEYVEYGVPEIRGELIKSDGTIEKNSSKYRFISVQTSNRFPRTILKEGDFALSVRGSMGKVGIISKDMEGANITANLIRISPIRSLVYSPYLKFVFLSNYFQNSLEDLSPQTTIKTIRAPILQSIPIPLPPLPEQRRIAAKIQELMQEVDRARAACEKQLGAAKALPAAYLRKVFDSQEAKNWEIKKLGEAVLFIKNGIVVEQNFDGKGFPVTRIETISNGFINSNKIGWVNLPLEEFSGFRLNKGDILFSHINSIERLGNCAIYEGMPERLYHGMNLLRIKAKESILDPFFLLLLLRSNACRNYFITNARRAIGQASLNQKDLKQMPIQLPPLPSQQHFGTELREKMANVEKLCTVIEKRLETIKSLPQTIFIKAFAGKL